MDENAEAELLQIIALIEQAWIDPSEADFPQLVGTLTERQRHLARIQDFDVSELAPSIRRELHKRLEHIVERDRILRDRVEFLRESLVKQADELRRTRRGAEGYRRVAREPRPAFDRTA